MGNSGQINDISDLVVAARAGDLVAYRKLVRATQAMALGVCLSVLKDPDRAQDAVQDAYLRAYRRLPDLKDPAAFPGWLRRIVMTVALNLRRAHRETLISLEQIQDLPVLDETERRWSGAQRLRLAAALLMLSPEERRICDRRYHGGWSLGRLAADAGIPEPSMRKRLQRIRDRLRQFMETKEIEMVQRTRNGCGRPGCAPIR